MLVIAIFISGMITEFYLDRNNATVIEYLDAKVCLYKQKKYFMESFNSKTRSKELKEEEKLLKETLK